MIQENKKIKVLHIITRMIIGGAQENTLYTVIGLNKKKRYAVKLFSGPAYGPEGSLIPKASRNCELIISRFLVRNINPFMDLVALADLYFFIKKNRFEIVHTHSSKAGILGRIAAKLAKTPTIVHTVHGLPFFEEQHKLLNKLYLFCEKFAAKFTDKIICVSPSLIEEAVKFKVAPRDKFLNIYSAIDLNKFKAAAEKKAAIRSRIKFSSSDIVIGSLGRLFINKGHDFFLQAAKSVIQKYPGTKFILIGDGILKNKLKKIAQSLKIEKNVLFTGLLEPEKVPEYLQGVDILMHTSLHEGLPRAIVQALALEIPVICFDIDGARDIVKNNVNGFLISPKNTRSLADAAIKLIEDRILAKKMGQEGAKLVRDIFGLETMISSVDFVYRDLLLC